MFFKKDKEDDFKGICPKCGSDKITVTNPALFAGSTGNSAMTSKMQVNAQNQVIYMCGNCGNNFREIQ